MNTYQKLGSVLAFSLGCATAANADIVYSNLGEIGVINSEQKLLSGWMASEFSPDQNSTLEKITLRLDGGDSGVSINPGTLTLQVYSDGGNVPGSLLYSLTTPTTDFIFDQDIEFNFTPAFVGDGSLSTSQQYWARLSTDVGTSVFWVGSGGSARAYQRAGESVFTNDSNSWQLQVNATPASVPIPGAAWLMGSALAGLVASARRKAA
jgi:hypothetical protein